VITAKVFVGAPITPLCEVNPGIEDRPSRVQTEEMRLRLRSNGSDMGFLGFARNDISSAIFQWWPAASPATRGICQRMRAIRSHTPTVYVGMSTNDFDLDRYLRVSGATKPESFDWNSPQRRLDDEALFCLGYMIDIESHTIVYLRELLSTRIVREVDVTSFLSCWAYEEFFHSQVATPVPRDAGGRDR
jgi:hypothetical protein